MTCFSIQVLLYVSGEKTIRACFKGKKVPLQIDQKARNSISLTPSSRRTKHPPLPEVICCPPEQTGAEHEQPDRAPLVLFPLCGYHTELRSACRSGCWLSQQPWMLPECFFTRRWDMYHGARGVSTKGEGKGSCRTLEDCSVGNCTAAFKTSNGTICI